MKSRVIHIINNFKIGGAEKLLSYFFDALDSNEFDFLIVSLSEEGELKPNFEQSGYPVKSFHHKGRTSPQLIFDLVRFMIENEVKIVHTHNLGPHFYGGWAVWYIRNFLKQNIKWVHTQHGLIPTFSWKERLKHSLINSKINTIIAVSKEVKNFIQEKWRFNGEIQTITNGVAINNNNLDRGKIRKRIKVATDDILIGSTGRLEPVKDFSTLIKGFYSFQKIYPDSKLIIMGDGSEREKLIQLTKELELEEKVVFTGMVDDVSSYLAAIDIFVLPSLSEGTSIALLEAMGLGIVPVCTNVGGNPEVIQDGYNGFLFEPKQYTYLSNLLVKIIEDQILMKKLSENARKTVDENYSIENMVKQYLDVYWKLMYDEK